MIDISLIALKFAALIVGGVFAAIGLLTDYRDKSGKVTKWGRIALVGIVLSTIIAAGMQAIESYRDRMAVVANDAANRKSEEQTQIVLGQIRRAIYPLRTVVVRRITIIYPTDEWPFSDAALVKSAASRPSPSDPAMRGFLLDRDSPDYPKAGIMRELLNPYLEVKFWKNGADTSKDAPDLAFWVSLREDAPFFIDKSLYVSGSTLPVSDDMLELSQRMASFEDIRDGGEIPVWIFQPWRHVMERVKPGHSMRGLFQKRGLRISGFPLQIMKSELTWHTVNTSANSWGSYYRHRGHGRLLAN